MHNRGVAVRVACRLHNVCIKDVGAKAPKPVSRGSVPGFENESDGQPGDNQAGFCSLLMELQLDEAINPIMKLVHTEIGGRL
jgi:hypothetical protein